MIQDCIEQMIDNSKSVIPINENDYIKDGLLYCGKCHTPKQTKVFVMGKEKNPYCLCECESKKENEEKQRLDKADYDRRIQHFKKIGFPESDMQNRTFENDDMKNPKLTRIMQRYVEKFGELKKQGKGLILYGRCGTGKTYASCEVANALIDKGVSVLVTNFSRLTNEIQGTYDGKQKYIDRLNDFELLVIDDLGAERKSEYMQEMIYSIIDSRYRAGLPFIITTNMTMNELKNPTIISNSRIYDRILERCYPIEVNGENKRYSKIKSSYEKMKEMLE